MNIVKKIKKKISKYKERKSAEMTLLQMKEFFGEKGVYFLYVELPCASKIKLSSFERERQNSWIFNFNHADKEIDNLKRIYGKDITNDYILSVFDGGIVVQGKNRKVLVDFQSENQHIINGRRITTDNPKKYRNAIYTHGACTWRGVGVADNQTIASFLQKEINNQYPDSFKVVNSAIGRGSNLNDDFEFMKEQTYRAGDIVIVGSHGIAMSISKSFFERNHIQFLETSSLFNRPHNIGEWFLDNVLHTNATGNKVIAEKLYKTLYSLNWLENTTQVNQTEPLNDMETLTHGQKIYGDNPFLLEYLETLKPYLKGNASSLNGSIVMNCNPFTLGHRYLIEYASRKVDNLYIFVVEENKSYFNFKDRLDLVKKGTADLKNVVVLPSGNFIISATTFPGYFLKNSIKDVKIDCSNDLNVFAEYIAPTLNIKKRFAGEEPLDPITNQYNEAMAEILPKHGIEFDVIPRRKDEDGQGVISASRVRKYLEDGKLDEMKLLVPQTTYDYLVKRYNRDRND